MVATTPVPRIKPVNATTFTVCMEQLQEAYVTSIAATAGCLVEVVQRDVYGMDVTFIRPGGPAAEEAILWAQLKNTTIIRPNPARPTFSFQLRKSSYLAQLVKPRTRPKAILLVMATDPDQSLWTLGDHDSLSVFNCCYWAYLENMPVDPAVAKPSVAVPTANIFTAEALTHLMDTLGQGNPP